MKTILAFLNDKHWYLIAIITALTLCGLTFGMASRVPSLITPNKKITRAELHNELNYIIEQAKIYENDLDKSDAVKQALIDAGAIFTKEGTFNITGLLNTIISISAVAFGLDRNRKLKLETAKKTLDSS